MCRSGRTACRTNPKKFRRIWKENDWFRAVLITSSLRTTPLDFSLQQHTGKFPLRPSSSVVSACGWSTYVQSMYDGRSRGCPSRDSLQLADAGLKNGMSGVLLRFCTRPDCTSPPVRFTRPQTLRLPLGPSSSPIHVVMAFLPLSSRGTSDCRIWTSDLASPNDTTRTVQGTIAQLHFRCKSIWRLRPFMSPEYIDVSTAYRGS